MLLSDDMDRDLARRGLTRSRTHLLWLLAAGPLAQRDLAEQLGVAPRTVTGLVDGLEATGFVQREPHPTDRRTTLVRPTRKGAQVLADLQQGHGGLADALLGHLPDAELKRFTASLRSVVERLRTEVAGA